MSKIKTIHIVEALGGGVYTYFVNLSNYFGERQHIETTIIYSDQRPEINPLNVRRDFHERVNLLPVQMCVKPSLYHDFKTLLVLIKHIKRLRPNVVHLHSSRMTVLGRLAHVFSFSNSKLFYTPHGYSFLKKDVSPQKQKAYYLIEKYFAKLGGSSIACGDTEFNLAKKISKAYLVRNGVNLKNFNKSKSDRKNHDFTIGILGRITFARNPKLFNRVAQRHPKIRFMWIGDGELRRLITSKNIKVTGWYNEREEALEQLKSVDVYLQTSLWEGLQMAVLEAMTMKKPVLATNVIGNKDVVLHGKTGYLFDNEEELVTYIELLQDKAHRLKLGENGESRVKEFFDSSKNFKDLEAIYLKQ